VTRLWITLGKSSNPPTASGVNLTFAMHAMIDGVYACAKNVIPLSMGGTLEPWRASF
jgi:hypothetical protein